MIGGAKGIGIGIDFGIPNQYCRATSKPYIEKDVLDSLRVVASAYGKTNEDSDRSIVKNLVDPDNPFVISNAAFKLNSGFGKYEDDFTTWYGATGVLQTFSKIEITDGFKHNWVINKRSGESTINSFKVLIKGIPESGYIQYRYFESEDATKKSSIDIYEDGEYSLPNSTLNNLNDLVGFQLFAKTPPLDSKSFIGLTITQIPSFEGAFVTDGIDDLITSTKTVQEMGITNEVTVISLIHQTGLACRTNFICDKGSYWRCNEVANTGEGKTGIYGYTSTNNSINIINNILGDKNDYSAVGDKNDITPSQFSVVGYIGGSTGKISYTSSVAWYWTIIANKVLTTDQINQVIAYFNLDRTLNPDILCNTIKQGISNENHAEFGDKLIDYSGNGRDIQLNNLAWDGDSGIGKYNYPNWKVNVTQGNKYARIVYYDSINGTYSADFKGVTELYKSYGLSVEIRVNRANTVDFHSIKEDGIYTMTPPDDTTSIDIRFGGENVYNASCDITITQIPSHAGGLCLDGVNDFGKVTGMPIYKDYTAIVCREFISDKTAPILSKAKEPNNGAFVMEIIANPNLGNTALYSFGKDTPNIDIIQSKSISYQTKYIYNSKDIVPGNGVDSDTMWIGKLRDNHAWFANAAIYSLMTFPYSMSEFLIERQLKKHKLGTLYPDMVEFRPVINSNIDIKKINYWDKDWNVVNVGDYVSIGNDIKTNITVPNGYKVSKVTSNAFDNITIEKSSTEFIYDVKFYGIKKSPQKIDITIEQDENYVQLNPIINGGSIFKYLNVTTNKEIFVGDYIHKGDTIRFYVSNISGTVNEVSSFTVNGVEGIPKGTNGDLFDAVVTKSPQKINITIDEYIRYEDIVQPYPVLLRFNDENGNEVSWGGKFRVGSTITRIGSFYENRYNLLDGLYIVRNPRLNGNNLITPTHVVEKSMVFICDTEYLLDNNEPKCILSPRLLRIPNSSYKILGHIPDISGHGNHGKINNSAYKLNSGVNGYLVDFTTLKDDGIKGIVRTDSKIYLDKSFNYNQGFWLGRTNNPSPAYKVKVSGIPETGMLTYTGGVWLNLVNGINELPARTNTEEEHGFVIQSPNLDWSNLVIEQIGEYEGAYCLDGVDDFVTIPTLSSGGKQVLMKVNWSSLGMPIYEQRTPGKKNFAIISNSTAVAYIEGNDGNTYIDGILNNNIKGNELVNITHNITITNELSEKPNTSPMLGINNGRNAFAQMALYDFMLFDDISTDDKIKELNEYVGIEAKVEKMPYYWDAYGKTNLDEDKATIQQRGIAVGDYDITNYNHAYDKMSGYGGYEFAKFDNTSEWIYTNNSDTIEVVNRDGYAVVLRKVGNGTNYWHFRNTIIKSLGKDIQIGVYANKSVQIVWQLKYKLEGETDYNTLAIASPTIEGNINTYVTLPYKTEQEIADLNAVDTYYSIYFIPIDLDINEEVTIEMLPLYPNGLVYDGVTDYSENANIPAFTDYTYIIKRQILKGVANSAVMYKGNITVNQGGAFICNYCEPSDTNLFNDFSFGGLLRSNDINKPIIYGTKTSVNGNSITPGEKIDTVGINVGKWVNYLPMVFYKLILYPKTIPLLQINFLKNLMERDEIIDLNNPIFIQ